MQFVNNSGDTPDEQASFVMCLKPDSKTVLVEVAQNGELLAFQEGGEIIVYFCFLRFFSFHCININYLLIFPCRRYSVGGKFHPASVWPGGWPSVARGESVPRQLPVPPSPWDCDWGWGWVCVCRRGPRFHGRAPEPGSEPDPEPGRGSCCTGPRCRVGAAQISKVSLLFLTTLPERGGLNLFTSPWQMVLALLSRTLFLSPFINTGIAGYFPYFLNSHFVPCFFESSMAPWILYISNIIIKIVR